MASAWSVGSLANAGGRLDCRASGRSRWVPSTVDSVLGYEVSLATAPNCVVEASDYVVDDGGALVLLADGGEVGRFEPGAWLAVEEFGVRLSPAWPTPELTGLLEDLRVLLGVTYGHYVHLVGGPEKYSSTVLNELDALTGAVLASVDVWMDSPSLPDEVADVRSAVARTFHVGVPSARPRASGLLTRMRCPRCGDVLMRRASDGTLRCPRGDMDLSVNAAEAIEAYCSSPPGPIGERSTSVDWGGRWFCPRDGRLMDAATGELPRCSSCGGSLSNGLLYQLIESHVHE